MPDKSVEQKNLTLNKVLVVLALLTLSGGVVAWVTGWVGMPAKVQKLESNQDLLMSLPPRIDNLEKAQAQMWQKRSEDHDLLLGISTSLKDLKEQSAETRQDVKDLHNKVIK